MNRGNDCHLEKQEANVSNEGRQCRGSCIKIEEGSTCEHDENRAQLAQQKGKEPQGAYTCQRKKKVEATGVQMKEGTSKKKNKTEGQLS